MNESQLRKFRIFRRAIHWLIAIALVIYVVTGFGITEFRIVDAWTFGLLSKSASMKIHNGLEWPFAILLAIHISVSLIFRKKNKAAAPGE